MSRLEEQSARITLIEDALLNKYSASKEQKVNLVKKIEESRSFFISNKLPLDNDADLKMFEENLNQSEFHDIAVSFCINCI